MKRSCLTMLVATTLASAPSAAQVRTAVPVREAGVAEATSADSVGFLYGVRELSDGRLLVNDAGARRVLLLDATLRVIRIVADSSAGSGISYGRSPTGIVRYVADSTLLVDLTARAFLVIDPQGTIVRVMSVPRPADVAFMWNPAFGTPGFDGKGRLFYRGWLMPAMRGAEHGAGVNLPATPSIADSAPILRADLDARVVDTLGWVRIPKLRATMTPVPGGMKFTPTINPVSTIDDWVLLGDGTIAIVRGQDYHIDWIAPDGTRSSSPKMPFDWKRLSEEEKAAIVDSTRRQLAGQVVSITGAGSASAAAAATMPLPNPAMAAPHTMPVGGGAGVDREPGPHRASADTAREAPNVVSPDELPDYLPPVLRSGTMRADPDGNIWILPSTSSQAGGGLIYDVINRSGEVFQRVRLPQGRVLQGFGAGGVIYMTSHVTGGPRLERARLR
jgi:hypothetical protein